MRITVKLALTASFLLLATVILIQGIAAIGSVARVQAQLIEIGQNWLPSVEITNVLNTNTSDMRIAEGAHVMSTDDAGMSAAEADIKALQATIDSNINIYKSLISSPEEQANFDVFLNQWGDYIRLHDKLLALSRSNQNVEAANLFKGEMRSTFDAASKTLLKAVKINKDGSVAAIATSEDVSTTATNLTYGFIAIGLLFAGAVVIFTIRRVIRPLNIVNREISVVAGGNYAISVSNTARADEIGEMARSLDGFRVSLAQSVEAQQRQQEAERAEAARLKARADATDRFLVEMEQITSRLADFSEEVSGAATNLSSTAEETSRQAQTVAGAAEEASTNVQTVASSAEELAASVREINSQVLRSSKVADEAYSEAAGTNTLIQSLADSAQEIGDVVNIIRGIADQTNLLALNATIEAARAGEAGRGFAVVASEVKQLATQTAKATEEIAQKVVQIQNSTGSTVSSISEIVRTIGNIKEISSGIAGAVEEQGAATAEIAANCHLASEGAHMVTSNIASVGQAAEMTGSASTQLMGLSTGLSAEAKGLRAAVETFARDLKAA